jgi:GNAT superfamily N-acetyltransferase
LKIELVNSESDIAEAAKVLMQLRPQYSLESIIAQIKKQQEAGYKIACARVDDSIVGVAGFIIGEKLAWGKHIYVDDLVTDQESRSTGIGAALIAWLRAYGGENGCQQLHLDSSVVKHPAHRFYLRNGFNIASHHFSITELSS